VPLELVDKNSLGDEVSIGKSLLGVKRKARARCCLAACPPSAFFDIAIQILLDKVIDGLYHYLENSVLVTDISG